MKTLPDKGSILNSLAAIARDFGRAPSRSEFISLSGISEAQISRFFPTWTDVVRAAGFQPYTVNTRLRDRELLADWAYAVRRTGKTPARRAYLHLGQYDPRTFRRFGPWSKLPEVFRKFARGKPEWADVVALLPRPARKRLPKRKPNPPSDPVPSGSASEASNPAPNPPLDSVIPSVARDPGVIATQRKPVQNASVPTSPNNTHAPTRHSPGKVRYPHLDGRPTYGQPMDFRGLRHEPVNEQGVVLLFGMVAKELGYTVEAVQSGFPDCEAKRQIAPQRWQRVHLEFEFESRNFRDHGHPLTGCDVIVCWRHNWPACPAHIEILELSSLLPSLPTSED